MSVFTLLTVLFLLVLGATIAWLGDVIGYRLGKSRRSLFGMRPRRTARFVGMLAGALLPIAGLGVAALGSEHVRLALFHIEDLQRQQEELQGKLSVATDAAQEAERHSAELTRSIAAHARDLEDSRVRLSEVRARLTAAQANLQTVTARSAALTAQVATLQRTRDSLRQTLTQLKDRNEDLQKQYRKATDDLASADRQLKKTRKDNNQLSAANVDLASRVDQLQREVEKSQSTLEKARDELTDAEDSVNKARFAKQEAEIELADARKKVAEEQRKYERFKFQAEHPFSDEGVVLDQGQELVRFIIDARQTQDQIVSTLFEMLHFASAAAARHGAPLGDNGRAVKVVAPLPTGSQEGQKVTEADIVADVANQLRAGAAQSDVVRLMVARRLFKEDEQQADVAFVALPNRIAFAKRQTVLSAEVDGTLPRVNIFGALWNLIPLTRQAALAAGMLPDPETGQFGEAPAQQILDALDKIQQMHSQALVRVVAARDTFVAEPLVIEIEVTPAKVESTGG